MTVYRHRLLAHRATIRSFHAVLADRFDYIYGPQSTPRSCTFHAALPNPPRPLASRRVDALTKFQTLQTLKPLNKPTRGTARSRLTVRRLGVLRPPLTPQKVMVKPMIFQPFRF